MLSSVEVHCERDRRPPPAVSGTSFEFSLAGAVLPGVRRAARLSPPGPAVGSLILRHVLRATPSSGPGAARPVVPAGVPGDRGRRALFLVSVQSAGTDSRGRGHLDVEGGHSR